MCPLLMCPMLMRMCNRKADRPAALQALRARRLLEQLRKPIRSILRFPAITDGLNPSVDRGRLNPQDLKALLDLVHRFPGLNGKFM